MFTSQPLYPVDPSQGYIICSTPRTGSTLLCHLFEKTHLLGKPEEALTSVYRQLKGNIDYLDTFKMVARDCVGPNGVFGIKVMWPDFSNAWHSIQLMDRYKDLTYHQFLEHFFPGLKYIWIRRYDRGSQMISLLIAEQTQCWSVNYHGDLGGEATFDFFRAHDLSTVIESHEQEWQRFFEEHQIQPLILYYEDLINHHNQELKRVLDDLQIDYPPDIYIDQLPLKKQATPRNSEWLNRYWSMRNQEPYCYYASLLEIFDMIQTGRLQSVFSLIHQFPQDAPTYYKVLILSASLHLNYTHDLVEAEKTLNQAIDFDPNKAEAFAYRALLRCQQHRLDEASRDSQIAKSNLEISEETDIEDINALINQVEHSLSEAFQ